MLLMTHGGIRWVFCKMKRWLVIGTVLVVAAVVVVVILLWLNHGLAAPPSIGLSFTPFRDGHMGNFYSHHFTVAMVTNAGPHQVRLESPRVEWEENGTIVTGLVVLWGGTNYDSSLPPNGVMPLPVEVPKNSPRFRVCFVYNRVAGSFQRKAAPFISKVVRGRFTGPRLMKLYDLGLADGRLHLTYDSIWQTNQPAKPLD
jgi:hypothetical protein